MIGGRSAASHDLAGRFCELRAPFVKVPHEGSARAGHESRHGTRAVHSGVPNLVSTSSLARLTSAAVSDPEIAV